MKMIDEKLLQQAIKVLREINTKYYEDSSKKKPLLNDEKETALYLQFSLKKIPKYRSIKMIKIKLPHSLVKDNSEVCLITGDLDKRNHKAEIEPDVLHYKELLKKHGINQISEVITLRQLRTEYKPHEAKQKLLAAYDAFLADRKIVECLPRVLGRHFFKKRKFPIQITLNTPNLKQQIENALSTKVFYLTGHGNSCNSEVAYLDMNDAEIAENVTTMANNFCDNLPGSWDNVMGIYLKASLSKAIPVYMSYDDPNTVPIGVEKYDRSFEIGELSTCPNSQVKVYSDGTVQTVRVKRMAEPEICETADVGRNFKKQKMEKEDNIDDSVDSLTKKYSKAGKKIKKKKEGILLKEADGDACIVEGKSETADVTGNFENPKMEKEDNIDDSVDCLTSTDFNQKSSKVGKKLKKKKEGILLKEADEDVCIVEGKKLSDKIRKKSKSKKKDAGSISEQEISKSVDSLEEKGESNEISKTPKNMNSVGKRKSVVSMLKNKDSSSISSRIKEEIKKASKKSSNLVDENEKIVPFDVKDTRISKEKLSSENVKKDKECILEDIETKGKANEVNRMSKKRKSVANRKSVENTPIRDNSLISAKIKGKQKKRKSLANITG